MFRDYGSAWLAHLRNSFVQIKVKSVEVYTDEKISQKYEFCFLSWCLGDTVKSSYNGDEVVWE